MDLSKEINARLAISHIVLAVEFFLFALYPSFASFIGRAELSVGSKVIDFVLHVRHVSEIPGVHIKKSIECFDRQVEF
jgi:hypothetical protein